MHPTGDLGGQAREIFAAVVDAPRAEREQLLSSRCGGDAALRREVDELLRWHDATHGPLDRIAIHESRLGDAAHEVMAGMRIGQFEVEALIGEGGMGVVYRCRQAKPNRVVAVKLIRPMFATPSVLRRFEHEAEVLGQLQHPGIAAIIEAGTITLRSGPQPYVAMEFVDGVPIDRYCEAKLPLPRHRVGLLLKVCEAVEHAHRRGIIHRDLKPDNILVDQSGQPKVLDFGVARAAGGSAGEQRMTLPITQGQQLIGTLAYMSPEQAAGDTSRVDTRADVYALGATLFEILTGQLPIDLSSKPLGDAIRLIQEGRPRRLSSVDARLRGDLETIVAKALESEPARRYASVGEFAEDLRRWAGDLPISARPASAIYRMRKLVKRRPGAVIGSVIAVAALTVGGIVATHGLKSAATARSDADLATTDKSEIAGVLTKLVRSIDPGMAQGGETTALRAMLGGIAERVQKELADQPDLQAQLLRTVGEGYLSLGAYDEAVSAVTRARDLDAARKGEHSAEVAEDTATLGSVAFQRGDADGAEKQVRAALSLRTELFGENHLDVASSLMDLADIASYRANHAEAEELMRQAISIDRMSADPQARARLAAALPRLCQILERQQKDAQGAEVLDEAISLNEQLTGPVSAEMAGCLLRRSGLALGRHDIAAGEKDLNAALEMRIKVLGSDHSQVAEVRQELAQLASFRGDGDEAVRQSEAAMESLRRSLGESSPAYATALGRHGQMLAHLDRWEEAEDCYHRALAIFDRNGGASTVTARVIRGELLSVWVNNLQYEKALPVITRQVAEDEHSATIPRTDFEQELGLAATTLGSLAWNRVAADPHSAAAAEAPALARQAVGYGRRLLAYRADATGYRRYFVKLQLGSAMLAEVLSAWAETPEQMDRDAIAGELAEAEELLTSANTEANDTRASVAPGMAKRTITNIEGWTYRLYWLWNKVLPDDRVKAEAARSRATKGGAVATTPAWADASGSAEP